MKTLRTIKRITSLALVGMLVFEPLPFIPAKEATAKSGPERIDRRYQDASSWFTAQDAARRGGNSQDAADHQNDLWFLINSQMPDDSSEESEEAESEVNNRLPENERNVVEIPSLPLPDKNTIKSCLPDGTILIFDDDGRLVEKIKPDGYKFSYFYAQNDQLTRMIVTRPNGDRVVVNVDHSKLSLDLDTEVLEAAVVDLLKRESGIKRLTLKENRLGDTVCTRSFPPSCSTRYQLTLQSGRFLYKYEVLVSAPAYSKASYTAEFLSKEKMVFPPFAPIKVTASDGRRELTVSIDEEGNATVIWEGQAYSGYFDFETKRIYIDVPIYEWWGSLWRRDDGSPRVFTIRPPSHESEEWVIQLSKNDGAYYIKSFTQCIRYSSGADSTTVMTFGKNGLLKGQSWKDKAKGFESLRKEYYTYIHVAGKYLIESTISWGYTKGDILNYYASSSGSPIKRLIFPSDRFLQKSFYAYDAQGQMIAAIYAERFVYNGINTYSAYYTRYQGNKMTMAYTNKLTEREFRHIRSARDYRIIDRLTLVKTEYYFKGDPRNWDGLQYRIEYVRNSSGIFVARHTVKYDGAYEEYIVQGKPDIQSGETDDIRFNGRQWQDYNVYYGSTYSGDQKFGLVFSKWVKKSDGNFKNISIVVDYPKNKVVELDEKTYDIRIDSNGNLELVEKPNCNVIVGSPVKKPVFRRVQISGKDSLRAIEVGLS